MGRFFGPTPNIISAEGFFRGSGPAATAGKTWTTLTTGFETSADQYYQVYFLNSRWLITTTQPGVRQGVLVSLDGLLWVFRLVTTATTAIQTPSIAFGAGVYVVTGSQGGIAPRLTSSPDLVTWTARSLGFPANTFLFNPVFGNGVFVLVASGPVTSLYATSANGLTWTQRSAYVPVQWGQPIFDGTRFIAPVTNPSNVPKIVTSTDGINWTEATVGITLPDPIFIGNRSTSQYVIGDVTVTAGQSINGALTSASPTDFGSNTAWIAYGVGSDWAQCNGLNAAVLSSPDGLTWNVDSVPATAGVINNMAWNGTEWIAVGGSNASSNYSMTRGP